LIHERVERIEQRESNYTERVIDRLNERCVEIERNVDNLTQGLPRIMESALTHLENKITELSSQIIENTSEADNRLMKVEQDIKYIPEVFQKQSLKFIENFGSPTPWGIAINSKGCIYITDLFTIWNSKIFIEWNIH